MRQNVDSVSEPDASALERSYDRYPRIEEAFDELLDASLLPRGPDILYDLVADLDLPAGSSVLDLGCGEGRHTLRLAEQFGFRVVGVDPVARHIELSNDQLASRVRDQADLASRVRFQMGRAEQIPLDDGSLDLIWCRDVLVHVASLGRAYHEMRRVLRSQGHALIYQMFWGERIEPKEAEWLWRAMGNIPETARPEATELAIAAAGLRIDKTIELSSEWGEVAQESSGHPGRRLLHAARLLRDPERYINAYGQSAYEIKLADCLWHVYRMIGKLSPRIYLLSVSASGDRYRHTNATATKDT